jgi:dTDP-4-dehydrorhamnose reductase
MLGTELSLLFRQNNIVHIETGRDVDICDMASLESFVEKHNSISWIINCAAYTEVDRAEDDRDLCRLTNTEGPANIAAVSHSIGAKLIHISTDYVFDGNKKSPYLETDTTNPIGIYGLTKKDGEIRVLKKNEKSYIVRTAWLYGRYGKNFVQIMLKLMKNKDVVTVVNDQVGNPTWTFDLASVLLVLIKTSDRVSVPYGIYHYTGEGKTTWFDFAKQIYAYGRALSLLKKDCYIDPCTSKEFISRVKRPAYSVLDKTKIIKCLNINIPHWNTSLYNYLQSLQ